MKHSLTLAIVFATISSAVFAQMPASAPISPQSTNTAPTSTPEPMSGMQKRMEEHKGYMWKQLDANKDNSITKEESVAFSNKKFEEKDLNHDGKISIEEWDAAIAAKRSKAKDKMMQNSGMNNTPSAPIVAPVAQPTPAVPAKH